MKYFISAANSLNKYTQNKKKDSLKSVLRGREFKLLVLLVILLAASSCKTCNCPAYSYQPETSSENQVISEQKSENVNKYSYNKAGSAET